MNTKLLTLAAITFIPATLSATTHTGVGLGFNIGPVNIGLAVHEDCNNCCDTDCHECCACSHTAKEIEDELFSLTVAIRRLNYYLADIGVCRTIRNQINDAVSNIYYDWRAYTDHSCPDCLEEIKESVHRMAFTAQTTSLRAMNGRRYTLRYIEEKEDRAIELLNALEHVHDAMLARVSIDHLVDDFAECLRCVKNF